MSVSPFGLGFSGFSLMGILFPVIFFLVFGTIIGIFVVVIVKNAKRYKQNNASPVLAVDAKVVTKRADVRHHTNHLHDSNSMTHHRSSTNYYVTFEVESGDRIELAVTSQEYGMLVEADRGKLTFQGTRYKGFARVR